MWRGHCKEAKRGQPCRHRIMRNYEAMVSFPHTCATAWWSLIAGWCLIGETPRSQPWTPTVTLPHVCDGVSVLLQQVFCMFRRLSMCRPVHRQLMRNELHNFTTIVPVTVYHHGSYVETYSRSIVRLTVLFPGTPKVMKMVRPFSR